MRQAERDEAEDWAATGPSATRGRGEAEAHAGPLRAGRAKCVRVEAGPCGLGPVRGVELGLVGPRGGRWGDWAG